MNRGTGQRLAFVAIALSVGLGACTSTSAEHSVSVSSHDSAPDSSVTTPLESTTTASADGGNDTSIDEPTVNPTSPAVSLGARVLVEAGFAQLDGMRVGLITNPVSAVDGVHLIDWFEAAPNVELVSIFAAEHGVRGAANAGELIDDSIDLATGIPILSLYGDVRRPTAEMLEGIDALVFDLQDVGTRYFTYTATMGLAMQSAAEAGIPFVVLDRPNPLGGELVEGFMRRDDQISFISQYPIPAVHGLSAGELAMMIKAEAWLSGLEELDLRVVMAEGWQRGQRWEATGIDWIPPSPGLQTAESALSYPATVLFEATSLSYGAGTPWAFQSVAAPWLDADDLATRMNGRELPGVIFEPVTYIPRVIPNISFNPDFPDEEIYGVRIVITDAAAYRPTEVGVHLLEEVLRIEPPPVEPEIDDNGDPIGDPEPRVVISRPRVLDLLAGSIELRRGLEAGVPAAEIVAGWADDASAFAERTAPYRLY